jgi:hypothetical protein
MRYTFADLQKLLGRDPKAYKQEVQRMKDEDPEQFGRFIAWLARNLSKPDPERPAKARLRRHSSLEAFVLGRVRSR